MSYDTKVPPIETCPDLLKGVQAALDKQIKANLLLQEENKQLTGLPYAWSETRIRLRDIPKYGLPGYANVVDSYGQQLADQNGIPWVKTFDPSWKLHELMLMRLKGKV